MGRFAGRHRCPPLPGPARRVLGFVLDGELLRHQSSATWPVVLSFLCDAAVWPQDPVSAARLHPLAAEYAGLNLMGGEFPAAAEVLCLVGSGYSNRRIAEQLVITENTAANHVRNILTKTGAANRTRAAMYAASHGLLQQCPVSGGSRPSAGHGVQ